MKSASSSSAFGAFAAPDAGFGYFATAKHYRHLAKGVLDAFHRGGLVLVTGDPPVCLPMLTEELRKSTPRAVVVISCGPALDCRELLARDMPAADLPPPGGVEGEGSGRSAKPNPICLFDDADRLSDAQIETILDAAHAARPDAPALKPGVLVASSSFPTRFDGPVAHRLKEGLAAHLRLQQLDRDEVEPFIRYQLPSSGEAAALTAQRVALIAIASGGDPAVVNRLVLRALEEKSTAGAGGPLSRLLQGRRTSARKPVWEEFAAARRSSISEEETAAPRMRRRAYVPSLRLSAGAIVCVCVLGLIVVALSSEHLIGFFHNQLVGEAPPPAALSVVPPSAEPSSPPNIAPNPPQAARESAAPAEPQTTGAEEPTPAAPAPPATPQSAASPAPVGPRLSSDEIAALVARGDRLLAVGDITSARLFFQRAADAGDARAAMRMALTFDTGFLDRAGIHRLPGDPDQAAFWYRRARDLGENKPERDIAPANEAASQPR